MKRSLLSLLLILGALAACNNKPPGQLEPIPRPADYQEPPPKAEAPKPPAAAPQQGDAALEDSRGPAHGPAPGGHAEHRHPLCAGAPRAGDMTVRLAPEGAKTALDQGTVSDRGFILDGLGNVDRTWPR